MQYDRFAGSWIYRSFVNRAALLPDLDPNNIVIADVAAWAGYLFGQGVMTFHPSVTGGLTGTFQMGTDGSPLDMLLLGKIEQQDGQTWFRWNARGVANTPTDGWAVRIRGAPRQFVAGRRWPGRCPGGLGHSQSAARRPGAQSSHRHLGPSRSGRVVHPGAERFQRGPRGHSPPSPTPGDARLPTFPPAPLRLARDP